MWASICLNSLRWLSICYFVRRSIILGFLEAVAAVRRVHALERKVSTPLAWILAIAFYLSPLALIAVWD
jgi:hypothetical protein